MGYLYLLELSDGVVKVGVTHSPEQRLETHRHALEKGGRAIFRRWLSPSHWNFRSNETDMIHALTVLASRGVDGREWFAGVPMDVAVGMAMTLDFKSDLYGDYSAGPKQNRERLNVLYSSRPGLKGRVETLTRALPTGASPEACLLIIAGLDLVASAKGGAQ
jgi:hypothetical protein